MGNLKFKLAEIFFQVGEYLLKNGGSASLASMRVEELEFTYRATRILRENEILFVGQLIKLSEKDLLKLPGLGRWPILDIKYQLSMYKLKLREEEN